MPNITVKTRSRKLLAKLLNGPTQFGLADAARGLGHVESDHPGMDFEPGPTGGKDEAWYRNNEGEEDQASVTQSTFGYPNESQKGKRLEDDLTHHLAVHVLIED
ncbi:MAG: hypothetical protein Q9182_003868 [Xanthomendoza sp. 2 TL-2023]